MEQRSSPFRPRAMFMDLYLTAPNFVYIQPPSVLLNIRLIMIFYILQHISSWICIFRWSYFVIYIECTVEINLMNIRLIIIYVCCEGLWRIMAKFGCPQKLITMVRQFHDGMMASVQDQSASSASFSVTNGVKQGCVLAPTLFSMMFSAMLQHAFTDDSNGIKYNCRFDGGLFNLRRLQAKTKIQNRNSVWATFLPTIVLLLLAQKADMQHTVNLFSSACGQLWLDHQYQENWSYVPTSSWQALCRTNHHCQQGKASCCRQLHLLGEYSIPFSQHWCWS